MALLVGACLVAQTVDDLALAELAAPVERRIEVPAGTHEVAFPLHLVRGTKELRATLLWEDGEPTVVVMRAGPAVFTRSSGKPGAAPVKTEVPDACLEIPAFGVSYFVPPNPFLYSDAAVQRLRDRWARLPDVYSHEFWVSLRLETTGTELSMDGNVVGHLPGRGRLLAIRIALPPDVAVVCTPAADWQPGLPLDLRSLDRPGAMAGAELVIAPGALESAPPLQLPASGANVDVGTGRHVYPPHDIDNSVYRYYERSAFDAMPESMLLSVPVAPYTRAWVLCATEDDPTKEPVFRLRLTRYRRGGIGNAMVTATASVPANGEDTATRRRVGTVHYGAGAARRSVALWLAELPVDSGAIQDLRTEDWTAGRLDLELLGLSINSKSGVHVFAITLDRSPVDMIVRQTTPGSVFVGDDEPSMSVDLRSAIGAKVTLSWEVTDVRGTEVARGETSQIFTTANESRSVPVPLRQSVDGWYRVTYRLMDQAGRELLRHTAAFAQLPADTREAGYESPFGCWWQQHLHSRMTDPAIIGPLLHKAGIRRTTMTAPSEAAMEPWKVTLDMIPWVMRGRYVGDDPEGWAAEYETKIADHLARYPHVGKVMIFHESHDSTWLAPESWGGEPAALTAHSQIAQAKIATAVLREKFPDLQIIVGNSGWSGGLISELLRGGLPADRIDGLGMERLIGYFAKDTMPPERHEASWAMQQIGLLYGSTAPPTDCYESGGRGNYGMSQQLIARYVVRDSLIGLAWGYKYVGLGVISENVNGYYHTRWGGDALLRRTPYLYPQPVYVAIATMTRELDRSRYVRALDTGSTTVYALEFERDDERVYALWTPRGECDVTLTFPADDPVRVADQYGATRSESPAAGTLRLTARSDVTYVTTRAAITGVAIASRRFPDDEPPADAAVLDTMTDATWTLVNAQAVEVGPYPYHWLPWRLSASGRLSTAVDPARGDSLAMELLPSDRELPALLSECLTLRPAQPIPVPGCPTTLGVWVRGNSSWGRVMVEVIDAHGERFRGGEGVIEPQGSSYIDFDDWCFVSLPLAEESPVASRFLESPTRLWRSNGGDGRIDYPIRITGLIVETRRQALSLTTMRPVPPTLLLRDLSVYGGDSKTTVAATPTTFRAPSSSALYVDDFQHVPEGARPPGMPATCLVRDDAGRRYVAIPAGTTDLLKNLGYYGAPFWQDVELSLRFRFPDAQKIGLAVCLRSGLTPSPFRVAPPLTEMDRYRWLRVNYTPTRCTPEVVDGAFRMAAGKSWEALGLPALQAGRWYRSVIRVAGRTLVVSLEHDGRLVEVYRGPAPAGGGGIALQAIGPLHLAEVTVHAVAPTAAEWGYGDRLQRHADSPVPGTESVCIDGPFVVSDRYAVEEPERPLLLSAYLRSDTAGTRATLMIGDQRQEIATTATWQRYSFLALPEVAGDGRCFVGVQGDDDGIIYVAAALAEVAPRDATARRAEHWPRALPTDYEIDTQVAHHGDVSWRSRGTGRSETVQEGTFDAPESRQLRLSGWCRRDGRVTKARLHLELFRDAATWTPKTPTEVQPSEVDLTVDLTGGDDWHSVSVIANPRFPVTRYRLTVEVDSEGGTVWLDDVALRAVGAAPTVGAAPGDDLASELLGDDEPALLDLAEDSGGGPNLLRNPSFETPMPGIIVTRQSNSPSSIDPAHPPTPWFQPIPESTP